jgi:hypothetical protein
MAENAFNRGSPLLFVMGYSSYGHRANESARSLKLFLFEKAICYVRLVEAKSRSFFGGCLAKSYFACCSRPYLRIYWRNRRHCRFIDVGPKRVFPFRQFLRCFEQPVVILS